MSSQLLPSLAALAGALGAAWLLTYAVHSTVLVGAVWLAERRGWLRALRARDLAWRTALVGGLVTATLQLAVGGGVWSGVARLRAPALPAVARAAGVTADAPAVPEVPQARSARVARALPVADADASNAQESVLLRDASPVRRSPANLADRTERTGATAGAEVALRPDRDGASPVAALSASRTIPAATLGLVPALFAAWVLVATLLLVRWAVLRARVLASLGERVPVRDPLARARLAGLCRDAGHAGSVALTTAPGLQSPVALGWAEICLPAQALSELDDAQQRSVLAHELAHVRRHDPLWLVGASVLERLFFFQPLNRLARVRMQEVAEFLCDDWAAARDGSGLDVARGLATVAGWLDGARPAVPLAGMAEHPSQLLARVQRLLARRSDELERLRPGHVVGALALLGVTVLVAPGVQAAPETTASLRRDRFVVRPSGIGAQAADAWLVDGSRPSDLGSGEAPAGDAPATPPPPGETDRPAVEHRMSPAPAPALERTRDTRPGAARPEAAEAPHPVRPLVEGARRPASSLADARDAAPAAAGPRLASAARFEDEGSAGDDAAPTPAPARAPRAPRAPTPSVAPTPATPATAPVPPLPPRGSFGPSPAELARIQRDAQRAARDAQLQARDALRQARVRHGRHGARRAEAPADPKTVDALLAALKDADPGVRQASAESLARIGDSRAIEPLGALLSDASVDVRRTAVDALGSFEDARAIPALTRATKDASPAVRREAAEALVGVEDAAALPPLVDLLSDADPRTRITAVEGLAHRGDKRALAPLTKLVKDPNVEVRARAVRALAHYRDPSTRDALVSALKDENPEVRQSAAQALGELGLESAPQGLLDAVHDGNAEVRESVARALAEVGDARAVPQLRALLDDAVADVREAAVEGLSEIRDAASLQALIAAMQSKDATVRRAAAEALGQRD